MPIDSQGYRGSVLPCAAEGGGMVAAGTRRISFLTCSDGCAARAPVPENMLEKQETFPGAAFFQQGSILQGF
ncbi:MAG: hypothetical protein JJK50_08995 [Komagataeibacter rhaeticus]|nr:hypothetical protein [Komagataeibacter rhaeticus]